MLALISLLVFLGSDAAVATFIDNSVMGINWSPFHNDYYDSGDRDSVEYVLQVDFGEISAAGFDLVRTFYSRHSQWGVWPAEYASEYDVKLALGVHMYTSADSQNWESWLNKQIVAAAESAAAYPDTVVAIFVGNENVRCSEDDEEGDFTADELIGYIDDLYAELEANGVTGVPVGTVQRYTEWKSNCTDMRRVAAATDVIGANIYPFYVDSLDNIDENLDKFQDMVDNVKNNFPDIPLWITETGYSSGGSDCSSGQAPGTEADTEEYFNGIKEWASTNTAWADEDDGGVDWGSTDDLVFYFHYFDKKNATSQNDVCNNFLGIAYANGTAKFDYYADETDQADI